MKIAVISDYVDPANWGGAARVAVEQCRALSQDHDVLLVAPSESLTEIEGFNHEFWPYERGFRGIWSLRQRLLQAIRKFNPELAILHQPLSGSFVQRAFPRVETRYFFHSNWGDEVRSLGRSLGARLREFFQSQVLRRSQKVFVTSPFTEAVLHRCSQISRDVVVENPLGIWSPPHVFDPNARKEILSTYAIPENFKVACTFRRLIPRTGVLFFLKALTQVPDVVALIGGSGEMQEKLEQQVRQQGLSTRVRFLGYISEEEKIKIMQASDFSVVPSQELEGFGLATLESMACGCPVVATPVGNNENLIRSCQGGLISNSLEVKDFAKAMIKVLDQDWDREALSHRAANQYSWSAHAQKLLA